MLYNPKGYPWTEQASCVSWKEKDRIQALVSQWYGKVSVGDGADRVDSDGLDAWQKFAHDVVMDQGQTRKAPLRLMLLGTAGTGKSRTVRSFVGSRRKLARLQAQGCHQGNAPVRMVGLVGKRRNAWSLRRPRWRSWCGIRVFWQRRRDARRSR